MPLQVNNIIASATVAQELDLDKIYKHLPEICKYKPMKFSGLSMKLEKPRCTVLMFKSKRIVLTGLKTQEDGVTVVRLLSTILGQINNLKFHNFVGSFDQGHKVNLVKFYGMNQEKATYEMELFPGLQIRLQEGTATIFSTGKCLITGCKSMIALYKMYTTLHEMLKQCSL